MVQTYVGTPAHAHYIECAHTWGVKSAPSLGSTIDLADLMSASLQGDLHNKVDLQSQSIICKELRFFLHHRYKVTVSPSPGHKQALQ